MRRNNRTAPPGDAEDGNNSFMERYGLGNVPSTTTSHSGRAAWLRQIIDPGLDNKLVYTHARASSHTPTRICTHMHSSARTRMRTHTLIHIHT